jgi:hypothetical protein
MPSRKFVWDPQHWRFRAEEARTVADQMVHEARSHGLRPSCQAPRSKSPIRKEERLTIEANTGRPAQSELGILVAVVTGNFLHEPHDLAPQGDVINSHERFDQP